MANLHYFVVKILFDEEKSHIDMLRPIDFGVRFPKFSSGIPLPFLAISAMLYSGDMLVPGNSVDAFWGDWLVLGGLLVAYPFAGVAGFEQVESDLRGG